MIDLLSRPIWAAESAVPTPHNPCGYDQKQRLMKLTQLGAEAGSEPSPSSGSLMRRCR